MNNLCRNILIICLACLTYSYAVSPSEEAGPLTTDDLHHLMQQCKSSRRKSLCQLEVLWQALKNFEPDGEKQKDGTGLKRRSGTQIEVSADMPFHYNLMHSKRNLFQKRVSARCEYCLKTTSYFYWAKCVNECERRLRK